MGLIPKKLKLKIQFFYYLTISYEKKMKKKERPFLLGFEIDFSQTEKFSSKKLFLFSIQIKLAQKTSNILRNQTHSAY
jgi:hypothetical protein